MKYTLLTLICTQLLLAIDVRTSIPLVYHDGEHEIIGTLTLEVKGDDFSSATPQNPIYIRFRILQGHGWSKSLVDLRPGSKDEINQPINLSLFPAAAGDLNPAIPADAVQLVRLIKGERDGWIRITHSSSHWLDIGGGAYGPPSPGGSVAFTIGLTGYASVRPDGSTPSGGNEYADGSSVANTELCVNYANTPNFRPEDIEEVDLISFASDTIGVETGQVVNPGTQTGVTFSGDNVIARGNLYVARMEFHTQAGEYDAPPHQAQVSRLNTFDIWNYCYQIPSVYVSNSGDFSWEEGTRLYVCLPDFWPEYIGTHYNYQPNPNLFLSEQNELKILSPFNSDWDVEAIYHNDYLVGYKLELKEGTFPADASIEIQGLTACMNQDSEKDVLFLSVWADVIHTFVTNNEFLGLGPRTTPTLELEKVEDTSKRMVVPYTAFDRDDWQASTRFVNQSDQEATLTAFLYNKYGIELRIWSQQKVPPYGSITLNIEDEYGPLADSVLAWVEVLSDQPIASATRISDLKGQSLDVFSGVKEFRAELIAPHIPSQPNLWNASGYIVSSNLAVDAEFFVKYPQSESSRIPSIVVPGSTANISNVNFDNFDRPEWYKVHTTKPSGSGILFYNKLIGDGQLASVPLEMEPNGVWKFDHLGNTFAGWWNGLVMVNPYNQDTQAELIAYDEDYRELSREIIDIPAEARIVNTVENLMMGLSGVSPSRLEISSNSPIVSMLLIGIDHQDILTSIPGTQAESQTLTLPYIASELNSWNGLALVNPSERANLVTLKPYTASGFQGPEVSLAIQPNGKTVWLLEDLFPTLQSYTSLRIEGTYPIRGMALTGNLERTQLATVKLEP